LNPRLDTGRKGSYLPGFLASSALMGKNIQGKIYTIIEAHPASLF
jgi:hypothetical protein